MLCDIPLHWKVTTPGSEFAEAFFERVSATKLEILGEIKRMKVCLLSAGCLGSHQLSCARVSSAAE